MAMTAEFVPHTEEQILAARIGKVQPLNGRIVLVDYDPEWPRLFEREATRIRDVLGAGALRIEHAGSTSNEADRELYLKAKRELAQRDWKYTQNYADAKTQVVREILARAESARNLPPDL